MTFDEAMELGMELARRHEPERALDVFRQVQVAFPDNIHTHHRIGKTLSLLGDQRGAAESLFEAVRRNPELEVIRDLVEALFKMKAHPNVDQVCGEHRQAVGEDPLIQTYWGSSKVMLGQEEEGLLLLGKAREALPSQYFIYHNMSIALLRTGRAEEAVACYAEILPAWDGTAGEALPVDRLDAIANGYDTSELHNFFSHRLLLLYQGAFPGRRMKRVLELGTGTGLLASKLPASASEITGIERSPAMLAQARERNVYDHLVEGGLPECLDSLAGPFETVLSSCVLYYFADLQPFFRQTARLLAPEGVFLFSVDPLDDGRDIAVTHPGEYAHSRAYLRRLAAETGFREVAIEIDRHRGPPGFWCAFRKA